MGSVSRSQRGKKCILDVFRSSPLETGQEREIFTAADGLDNEAIAKRLFISQLTVKTHINRAMTKLDVHDRAALLTLAYKAGIRP